MDIRLAGRILGCAGSVIAKWHPADRKPSSFISDGRTGICCNSHVPARIAMDIDRPPLVSVVMPSLNQRKFVASAVESVLSQSWPLLELIVADGGSTDGTLDVLHCLQARDPRVRVYPQADAGPADALNKAMARVRGTLVGWLNSDDLYAPGAIQRAVDALRQRPEWVAVYGHGQHVGERGEVLGPYPSRPPTAPIECFHGGCFICQPTLFFRRTVYVLLGPFDTGLKTAFDFDYWLRLFTRLPGRIGFVDELQACSRLHAHGITMRMRREVALEGLRVLRRHLGAAPVHWARTHIGEILDGRPISTSTRRQRREVLSFIHDAAADLAPADVQVLLGEWERAAGHPLTSDAEESGAMGAP